MERDLRERAIPIVLAFLVVFDLALVVWVFGLPELWFDLFHTNSGASEKAYLLLKRCGANWGAFAVVQAVAFVRWREESFWLAVVAGVRLSDVFTDPVYVIFAGDPSWFAVVNLPVMGVINLGLGVFFLRSYLELRN